MIKEIDYEMLRKSLLEIQYSKDSNDIIEYAKHYGHFGYNAVTIDKLTGIGVDSKHFEGHLVEVDSLQNFHDFKAKLICNDFTNIPRGNCQLDKVDEFEIIFDNYHLDKYEAGVYLNALPFIEHIKNLYNIKSIKINCNSRIAEVFEEYFPYIQIGTSNNKVTVYELIERTHITGGNSSVMQAVKQISKRIVKIKDPKYVGTHWFSNTFYDRYRSIPMGVLINTIGNNDKDLEIMSLQYNNPKIDIELFNMYSKNKISQVYNNDINTSLVDTIAAVSECYMYVGIQSEVSMIASSLCGIPTMITASSPNIYWYLLNGLNPYVNVARMRYSGDYEYITNKINKFI
jgi:hypothetical protein